MDNSDQLNLAATATIVAIIGFLVSGAFISVLYYPELWLLLAIAAVLEKLHADPNAGDKKHSGATRIGPRLVGS
jgi:hypothetical protein